MAFIGEDNDTFMSSGEIVKDHGSLLSLQPWIFMKANCHVEERMKAHDECSDTVEPGSNCSAEITPQSVRLGFRRHRRQKSLRSIQACRYSCKPISLVENCLAQRLFDGNFDYEDYIFTAFPAPAVYARPLVITDGRRIISRQTYHRPVDFSYQSAIQEEVTQVTSDIVDKNKMPHVSPLPRVIRPKCMSRETPHDNLDMSSTQRCLRTAHSEDVIEVIHLFSVGLTIGTISTILSNREEIKKLKDLFTKKEYLVQDLQEELEMRESLTIKELVNDTCWSQKPNGVNLRLGEHLESSENQVSVSYIPTEVIEDRKVPEIPEMESMSKMEEELKAELEALDINMNTSCTDGKRCALEEIDLDIALEDVCGGLKVETHRSGGQLDGDYYDSDNKKTSENHTCTANYAVSPRELSIRLHEVIELRLEERIRELELALQQNQRQIETERNFSARAYSSSEGIGSSSNQGSPTSIGSNAVFTQPFCLNIQGDALDAYNEAYEEFIQMAEKENLDSASNGSNKSNHSLYSSDQTLVHGMKDDKCFPEERTWDLLCKNESLDEQESLINSGKCGDECDDECRMIIRQILERTRHGSSTLMHAQRMLFSADK